MAWVVSNCDTNSDRELYVQQFQEFIDVDIYGKCGPFECFLGKTDDPVGCFSQLDRQYKFYLR